MSDRVKKFRISEPDFINKFNKYDSKYICDVFFQTEPLDFFFLIDFLKEDLMRISKLFTD